MSGAADIDMLSCAAHFDGTSAGADFYPAIQVLDEAGQVAATVIGPKVTAGDSAEVTFAPFLENPQVAATGGGIQFDTYPQAGDFLYTESTGTLTNADAVDLNTRYPGRGTGFWQSFGTLFLDSGGDDIGIVQPAGGTIDIIADTASHSVLNMEAWEWFVNAFQIQIVAGSNGIDIAATGAGDVSIEAGGTGHIVLNNLPVVNPGGSGRLWNNGGFVAIT